MKPHDTSSGTYVKLSEKTSFELNQGDILRLGDARLSVRKTEAWAVSGWLDSMLLKLALCLFKVEDGHRERLKPLGETYVWNRFRAYRKRSGSATTRRWGAGVAGGGLLRACPLGSKVLVADWSWRGESTRLQDADWRFAMASTRQGQAILGTSR